MATPEEIERVKRGLGSGLKRKRRAMADYVRALPHEEAVEIAQAVYDVDTSAKRWSKLLQLQVGMIVLMPLFIVPLINWIAGTVLMSYAVAAEGLFYLGFIAQGAMSQLRALPALTMAGVGIAPDERLVGPLLLSQSVFSYMNRILLNNALVDSLLLLTKDGFAALSLEERTALIRQLQMPHIPLQRATLNALCVGEAVSAIPEIERTSSRHRDPTVVRAADACLARLYEVRAAHQLGVNLLRPSQADAVPETLLRPVSSIQGEQEQQLLRPHE